MSTVQGDEKCPRCGGVMVYDFNVPTQEEWRSCFKCGFNQEWLLDRDKEGKVITDDKHPYGIGRYHEGGFGIVVTTGFDGNGRSEVLTKRPSYKLLKEQIKAWKRHPYIEESECYIGLWDRKRKKVKVLWGKEQPSYEEFEATCPFEPEPVALGAAVAECTEADYNNLPF